MKKTLILLCMGMIAGPLYGNARENPWVSFINNPGEKTYIQCREMVEDSEKILRAKRPDEHIPCTPVRENLFSRDKIFDDFVILVSEGNTYAIKLGMQVYPFTDAGTMEDICQALSTAFHADPINFLKLLKQKKNN